MPASLTAARARTAARTTPSTWWWATGRLPGTTRTWVQLTHASELRVETFARAWSIRSFRHALYGVRQQRWSARSSGTKASTTATPGPSPTPRRWVATHGASPSIRIRIAIRTRPATIYFAGRLRIRALGSRLIEPSWTRLAGADAACQHVQPVWCCEHRSSTTPPFCPTIRPITCSPRTTTDSKDTPEGGFGESWNGGTTWVIHPPADGMGTSHYVLPISATTWCVSHKRPTTACGKPPPQADWRNRRRQVPRWHESTAAWTRVSQARAHSRLVHPGEESEHAGTRPGLSTTEGSIWKSDDDGATWPRSVRVLLA